MTFFYCTKKNVLPLLLLFFTISIYSQSETDSIENSKKTFLKNSNSWSVGAGASNFIMHGDLRSLGTNQLGNFWNFGGYAYVSKMFNPLLGLELRLNYNKISGGAQYLSDIYNIYYVPYKTDLDGDKIPEHKVNRERLFFDGRAYGAELNFILSFSNLYWFKPEKWKISGILGIGYHQYNSALFEKLPNGQSFAFDDADFGKNPERNSKNEASSIYLTTQLSVKRRITKRIDLEFRTGIYFNYEDHLDALITRKQDWETFFVNSLGIAIKLGKNKSHMLWEDKVRTEALSPFKVVDTDNDGVMDQLDKSPNTPTGVMVYANGTAIDSDEDTVPDYKDKCKFEPGSVKNDGCPIIEDTDGDGIPDKDDACPNEKGLKKYNGCLENKNFTQEKQDILDYSKNIYFDTDSNKIGNAYYQVALDEVASIMLNNPNISFSVSGYTDNLADEAYNLKLSQRRAEEIKAHLVLRGVEADRISAKGYGEVNPKYPNQTEKGRQLNRRVEIKSIGYYTKK